MLGRGMQCWFVRAGEKVGTVGASSINAGANLEGRLEEGYYAYLTQAEANWQALNSFLEEANSQYSADQRVWPLEVRHEYDLLEVKCGVVDPWVDECPTPMNWSSRRHWLWPRIISANYWESTSSKKNGDFHRLWL